MNRRHFIAALGVSLGGGGTLLGTGAFTSVTAERDASVAVATEDSAYLSITPSPNTANGAFAHTTSKNDGNKIQLDFNDEIPNSTNPEGGIGVAPDSRYEFDDVFRVQNQGTQDIYVDITPISNLSLTNGGDVNLEFYIRDGDTRETIDGSNAELTVPVGKVRSVGVYIETADGSNYSIDSTTDSDQGSDTATIAADSTVDSGNAIDPGSP